MLCTTDLSPSLIVIIWCSIHLIIWKPPFAAMKFRSWNKGYRIVAKLGMSKRLLGVFKGLRSTWKSCWEGEPQCSPPAHYLNVCVAVFWLGMIKIVPSPSWLSLLMISLMWRCKMLKALTSWGLDEAHLPIWEGTYRFKLPRSPYTHHSFMEWSTHICEGQKIFFLFIPCVCACMLDVWVQVCTYHITQVEIREQF